TGLAAILVFTFLASLAAWFIIKMTMGIRLSEEQERIGADRAEVGIAAYPEFTKS
ncbi:MAG TPA: ammonium transporter, partial [Gammaproteobacteria bacterium]|nr:ammonium transporter [Gammaproteobacteria bacterium]